MTSTRRYTAALTILGVVAGALAWGAGSLPAEAHTPSISADCGSGVVLKANSYDGSKANKWSVTLDGVEQSGTFGASLSKSIALPQGGATTTWSASITAHDGGYAQTKGGTLTCGKPTIQLPTLGTSPATCSSPGAFVPNFLTWPKAQNANGYEGDGFRIYLDRPAPGVGTYTATLQKVGPGFDPRYPNGTTVTGQTTQVLVIEAQIADDICAGEQPESKVEYSEWVDEALTCDTRAVTQHRTKTTTAYTRVGQTWILDPASTTTVTETNYRAKTADEVKPCVTVPASIFTSSSTEETSCTTELVTITTTHFQSDPIWNAEIRDYDAFTEPHVTDITTATRAATVAELDAAECPVTDKPDDLVTFGDWVNEEFGCGDTTVVQSREHIVTPHVLVDRVWAPDAGNAIVTTESRTVALTAAQIAGLICASTDTPASLVTTGADVAIPISFAAAAAVFGAALIILAVRRRRSAAGTTV